MSKPKNYGWQRPNYPYRNGRGSGNRGNVSCGNKPKPFNIVYKSLKLDILGKAETHLTGSNGICEDEYKLFGHNLSSIHIKD